MSDVTFVSWNVHVGNGDIRRFIKDLREGTLTGRPVEHFVLLLQEALRSEGVPPLGATAAGALRIRARDASQDIVQVSRDFGLALIYVPSMRNGNSRSDPAADRGSAILSTMPLEQPVAVELPGERQRRVAIIAAVATPMDDAGTPLSVGVVHLDALGSARRLWVLSTPSMRESQVKAMAPLLPTGPLVLGADLNTWHGTDERAARYLSQFFPDAPRSSDRRRVGFRVLDYLFLRPNGQRTARSVEAPHAYGSDHRPLIGWIE